MNAIRMDELRRRHGWCRVVAHRGYSSAFPENTIEAFDRAIAAGADIVEMDLRLSCDGIIVCRHDATIGDDEVSQLSAADLAGRGIVLLSDVLPQLYDRIGILFDMKLSDEDFADEVIAILQRFSMLSQVVLGARSIRQVRRIRAETQGSVVLGFLQDYGEFAEFFDAGGDISRLWEEDCTLEALVQARCGDHPVWVTAGGKTMADKPGDIDADRLSALFALGVDGILVNDPVLANCTRSAKSP